MTYICPDCGVKFSCEGGGLYECPSCNHKIKVDAVQHYAGTDWDRESAGNWFNAFYETIRFSLTKPEDFFECVARGRGISRPFIFALIISFVTFMLMAAYQAGFYAIGVIPFSASPLAFTMSIPIAIGFVALGSIVAVPLLTAAGLLIGSAVIHLCLMIIAEARRTYWDTFRMICYASGPQLFQIVPLLGNVVAWGWQLVLWIIGVKVVHRTTYGRSMLAIFLPTIFCCGLLMLIFSAVAGSIIAALVTSQR